MKVSLGGSGASVLETIRAQEQFLVSHYVWVHKVQMNLFTAIKVWVFPTSY